MGAYSDFLCNRNLTGPRDVMQPPNITYSRAFLDGRAYVDRSNHGTHHKPLGIDWSSGGSVAHDDWSGGLIGDVQRTVKPNCAGLEQHTMAVWSCCS